VRKIDELGRIVIPKEIRNILKIESYDDLEIYVDNNSIILKKFLFLESDKEYNNKLILSLSDLTNGSIYLSDKEKIITSGDLENSEINLFLKKVLVERSNYISTTCEEIIRNKKGYYIIKPIIKNSDAIGLIIIISNEKLDNNIIFFSNVLKNLIEKN
jgi:stage V sporulation protein T